MKKPKLKKPTTSKLPKPQFQRVKTLAGRRAAKAEQKVNDAISSVPRITNETVAGHREEVLSSARKYIYPLQHSKHHVVRISIGLLLLVIVLFFTITGLELYKFQSTSTFMYDITRVIPFPVAKAGGRWVSYESYLFELRRNMHYYITQQQANFSTKDGKNQLDRMKHQALDQVINDAYVKQLADTHNVQVSDQAVNDEITLLQKENRLSNSHFLKEVLNEYWGWDESDFKRKLKQQLLQQAVVAKLDTATQQRAQTALGKLKGGEDFGKLASEQSDDLATKTAGGQYPGPITLSTRELPPLITAEIFKLKPGQISPVVSSGYTLDIVKVIDATQGSVHAAHIQFNLADISKFVKPEQRSHPAHQYIKFS